MSYELTRRQLLRAGVAGGAAVGTYGMVSGTIARALAAAPPTCGRLHDIDHVVILVQENRSFDHYFGTYPGVQGFADPNVLALNDGSGLSVFAQPSGDVCGGHLYPFRLDTDPSKNGECTNDVGHEWGIQHRSWDNGAMDRFVAEHLAEDPTNGHLANGYYTRQDLPLYFALADNFTICDRFHCSVIGPTDPNRLYAMTATLDPDGKGGGPHLQTLVSTRPSKFFSYTWPTYPEQLESHGVSWKVYGNEDGNFGDNVLLYFKNYRSPSLSAKAFTPRFPETFAADVAADELPQVSWILSRLVDTEHPPAPAAPRRGGAAHQRPAASDGRRPAGALQLRGKGQLGPDPAVDIAHRPARARQRLPYQRAGELRRRGLPDRQDLSGHLQHLRPTAGARHSAPAERSGVLQEVAPPAHLGLQLTRDSACMAAPRAGIGASPSLRYAVRPV